MGNFPIFRFFFVALDRWFESNVALGFLNVCLCRGKKTEQRETLVGNNYFLLMFDPLNEGEGGKGLQDWPCKALWYSSWPSIC